MSGITKDELMQMARRSSMQASDTAVKSFSETVPTVWLEQFANAILERSAVECHQGVARMSNDIDGTSFYIATGQCAKAIRALKINTGD